MSKQITALVSQKTDVELRVRDKKDPALVVNLDKLLTQ